MKATAVPTPSQIIHAIDEAAESVNGAPGLILSGPNKGFYRSKFDTSEVLEVIKMAESFQEAGAHANYSKAELDRLLHRLLDVSQDVRPTEDAGWGIMRSRRTRLLDAITAIHDQYKDRQRAAAKTIQAPRAQGLDAGLQPPR